MDQAVAQVGANPNETLSDVSVIVPTFEAGDTLAGTLGALGGQRVIVVDAGSTDETAALAEGHRAAVVRAPRGRGAQLDAGAQAATTDWLLFLHGDTRLGPGWRADVADFVAVPANRSRAAVFVLRLDDNGLWPRLVEAGVRWRTRWLGLPYGDQGLLIHRTLYDEVGGYATELPLMEDVDIVRRLGRRRIVALSATATTSATRYRRDGYARRIARNLTCLAMYFSGAAPARVARFYEG